MYAKGKTKNLKKLKDGNSNWLDGKKNSPVTLILFTVFFCLLLSSLKCTSTMVLVQGNTNTADTSGCISVPETETFVFIYKAKSIKMNHKTNGVTSITPSRKPAKIVHAPIVSGLYVVGYNNGKFELRKTTDTSYLVSGSVGALNGFLNKGMFYNEDTNFIDVFNDTWEMDQIEVVSLTSFRKEGAWNGFSMCVSYPQDIVNKPGTIFNYFLSLQSDFAIAILDRT